MSRILYFDCLSGISGDMIIGALLDLGIDQNLFLEELSKIDVAGYELKIKKGQKNGITGTDFDVIIKDHHHSHEHNYKGKHHHEHRSLNDIEEIIDNSRLKDNIKDLSKRIFRLVAEAEAKIHNKSIAEVHFHEVGAIDSIVDIIGAAICINLLEVDEIYSSPLHLGTGFVKCAHGNIPVPAPATLEILEGVPVYSKGVESELVTPTGAAIIKTLAKEFKALPEVSIEKVGYGLGKKELEITNLLRVVLGKKKVKII
jgi:hypothetical protein